MPSGLNAFALRQIFLEVAVCLISFTSGLTFVFSSLLNTTSLASYADIRVTPDQVSKIVTCLSFGCLFGLAFITGVFEIFGRKTAGIITNLFIFIGSLMLYVAKDVYSLAFARVTQVLTVGGIFISAITICECVCPKRRGYFMVINGASMALGSLASQYLKLILNCRHIALISATGNIVSIVILSISTESPIHFAMQGQFDNCAKAFEWYRGESLNSRKELQELTLIQTERLKLNETNKGINVFQKIRNLLMTIEFQKAFSVVTLAAICLDLCVRTFQLSGDALSLQLDNSKISAISIANDSILIFALTVSCMLVTNFKRRTLLFKFGFSSVFLMLIVSFSIILSRQFNLFVDATWLTPALILLITFITNLGLVPITLTLLGEVVSLDQKGLCSFISGTVLLLYFNVLMKFTPFMIDAIGVEGSYSVYGFILFICLMLLGRILPETKDKTLQQIENELKGIVKINPGSELLKYT